MSLVIPAPAITTIPVLGGGEFPVCRVYCVGRNYAAHAREMGHDPNREPPFFFMKPTDAIVPNGFAIPYPPQTSDYQHEIELVVALKSGGANIPASKALDCVFGYAVGLDMTRRDLQNAAKKLQRPWELGKSFEHSGPCAEITPASKFKDPTKGAIWVKVNGTVKQTSDLADMIWNVADTISYLSESIPLGAGDIIFMGTPEGVAPVVKGDKLEGHIDGLTDLKVSIV